jgi:hypothetical protein
MPFQNNQKNYIKAILIFMAFIFSFSTKIIAQKAVNRLILWDVTASMVGSTNSTPPNYGYNANSDIDKQVREGLIKIITDTKDDDGVFNIYPFGSDILEYKSFLNTSNGRKEAINYIKNYKIDKQPKGYTNICGAWDKAMIHIDPKLRNVIYLFTDGSQNIAYGPDGINCLSSTVNKYCSLTKGTDTYTFYVSLNVADKTFQGILANACKNITVVTADDVKNKGINLPLKLVAKFQPLSFNVQDNSSSAERFTVDGGTMPTDLKKINADLEINTQDKLGIKATITSNKEGNLDVNFTLEDISGKAIATLKTIQNLNIVGKIKVSIEGSTEVTEIPINIINKKSPQLNFIIK